MLVTLLIHPLAYPAFSRGGGERSKTPNVPTVLLTLTFRSIFGATLLSVTVSLARERSDRAEGGCGWGYLPPMVGTFFSKIRVSKMHFKAYKNDFLGN